MVLALPETYMNLSGRSVRSLARYQTRPEIIVVHDDLDLPLGSLKVSRGRGAGGHNGVQSVINELGTADFLRVRIGIGRPPSGAKDFVLASFKPDEAVAATNAVATAAAAIAAIIDQGPAAAMTEYNKI